MREGKLLRHRVLVEGVRIDPRRVKSIQTLSFPRYKKEVQYFLGKINFLGRFISNFSKLAKHIIAMLRKGNEVKWVVESRNYFNQIKKDLTKSHVLISPNYSKEFFIFSFPSFDTLSFVLLQRNTEGL
jgi:hypothetical protein